MDRMTILHIIKNKKIKNAFNNFSGSSNNNYLIINEAIIHQRKIIKIKRALGISKEIEYVENEVLKFIFEKNIESISSLRAIINTLFQCNNDIKNKFYELSQLYDKPKKFNKKYIELLHLFSTNDNYQIFASNFNIEMGIGKRFDGINKCINYMFFAFAYKYINKYPHLYLNHKHLYMNYHFLIKWLSKYSKNKFQSLTTKELKFIQTVFDYDLIKIENDILEPSKGINKELEEIVKHKLPEKFKVDNIISCIGIIYSFRQNIYNFKPLDSLISNNLHIINQMKEINNEA